MLARWRLRAAGEDEHRGARTGFVSTRLGIALSERDADGEDGSPLADMIGRWFRPPSGVRETTDLVGLDVRPDIARVWSAAMACVTHRPSRSSEVAAGHLGKKSGRGSTIGRRGAADEPGSVLGGATVPMKRRLAALLRCCWRELVPAQPASAYEPHVLRG